MVQYDKLYELELKGKPFFGLVSSILALYLGFAGVAFFGASAPVFMNAMRLTPSEVGLLVAAPSLAGGLLRIPFGAWADSNGGRMPILILMGLMLVGLCAFAVIAFIYPDGAIPRDFFPLLLLCGMLTGCGVAIFTAGIAHVSYWFSEIRQGSALGVYGGIGGFSSGTVTALIPFGLILLGFSGVYIVWFFFVLIGAVVYYIISSDAYYFQLLRKGYKEDEARTIATSLGCNEFPSGRMKTTLVKAAKNRRTWALTVIYFSTFGGSLALTSWLPSFWTLHYSFPLTIAGILTGLSSIFSPFMRIFGGYLADRFGGEKISLIALMVCLIGSVVLVMGTNPFISGVGIFMMTGGIGLSNGSIFKLVPIYVHGAVGGASGIIGGVGAVGGFVIPPILGYTALVFGQDGYSKGFLIYSVLFVICLVVIAVLYATKNSFSPN